MLYSLMTIDIPFRIQVTEMTLDKIEDKKEALDAKIQEVMGQPTISAPDISWMRNRQQEIEDSIHECMFHYMYHDEKRRAYKKWNRRITNAVLVISIIGAAIAILTRLPEAFKGELPIAQTLRETIIPLAIAAVAERKRIVDKNTNEFENQYPKETVDRMHRLYHEIERTESTIRMLTNTRTASSIEKPDKTWANFYATVKDIEASI